MDKLRDCEELQNGGSVLQLIQRTLPPLKPAVGTVAWVLLYESCPLFGIGKRYLSGLFLFGLGKVYVATFSNLV